MVKVPRLFFIIERDLPLYSAVKLQHYRVNWLYIVVVGGGAALMIAYPVLFLLGEGFGVVR